MTELGIVWYFLIFVLIAGYFVLDGFDLGAGILSPFVAKNDEEKAVVARSIGPVWDGNEVWLLTAGGALFAAFPLAYATTFSGFYLAIFLVLAGLIVRALALEFGAHDLAWKRIWNALFFIGSLLPALLFGVAVGNVYAGIPMDANGDYAGVPLLGLVTPFTLLTGLLGLSLFVLQGANWLSLKAPLASQLRTRANAAAKASGIAAVVLFVLVSVYGHFVIAPDLSGVQTGVGIALAAVIVVALVFSVAKAQSNGSDLAGFIASSAACVGLVALWAASMFPTFVVAGAGDPLAFVPHEAMGESITVATAASSDLTLGWMLGIACVGVPLVLVYHVIIYRTFRGRISAEDLGE